MNDAIKKQSPQPLEWAWSRVRAYAIEHNLSAHDVCEMFSESIVARAKAERARVEFSLSPRSRT